MSRLRSVGYVALGAVLFGITMAVVKGDHPGLRGAIGNLSAPWLLVAFLPALRCRSAGRGAVTGLTSTVAALAGFYATLTVVLAGHLHGGGYLRELAVETSANRIYFVAGLVTGPLMGVLGAWVGTRYPAAAAYVVGGLVATEAAAVALVQGHQLAPPPFYFSWAVDDWRPYLAETLIGVLVLGAALWRSRRRVSGGA
ncbi:MAG: hypothetical protein QOK15_2449 [Nocardioidaceae bacterium]|jgi:hypothetical protein|nr:hypothetical protein [Nocardioidaceae bacterium]